MSEREQLTELQRTAPERIRLQISDDLDHKDEPFPYGEEVTWCQDSVMSCEVEYVRADLARAALAASPVPADPMDWPLPCDVTVGHVTMRKGVHLRALVARMGLLYQMATEREGAPTVPGGWKAIPPEMGAEVLSATIQALCEPLDGTVSRMLAVYKAIFATAPTPAAPMLNGLAESAASVSAPAQQAPGKYDHVLRPFVALMERELHANSSKGDRPGWLSMSREVALLEIYWHAAKLSAAVKNNDAAAISEHSADVANMAMMLLDVCGGLDVAESAAPAPSVEAPAQPAERECRHCGWLCRPNAAESQRWYPLTDPAPAPAVEAQIALLMDASPEKLDEHLAALALDPKDVENRGVKAVKGALAAIKAHQQQQADDDDDDYDDTWAGDNLMGGAE